MSITTYTELKTAVENWLDHTLFTARVPEFIALFEATANRRLRVQQQETQGAALIPSAVNGSVPLPADYLAWRHVTWQGTPTRRAELRCARISRSGLSDSGDGHPGRFHHRGHGTQNPSPEHDRDQARLLPEDSRAATDAAATNWLLAAHPDLYLFGALVEAEMFGVNDERAPLWKARRDEIFDEIEKLSNKTRGAGAIRVMGVTP